MKDAGRTLPNRVWKGGLGGRSLWSMFIRVLLPLLAMVGGLALALVASRRALVHAEALAAGSGVSRFLIGSTLLAIGTDLPEIANSIVACLAGHGDINLGDSIGSALVQGTLVLGLLGLVAGPLRIGERRVALVGVATIVALGVGALMSSDGYLSRLEGSILIALWLASAWIVRRYGPAPPAPSDHPGSKGGWRHVLLALTALAVLGSGATLAVTAFISLSATLGVAEYLISFFVAAVGTSLPELFVGLGACQRGEVDLAIGDVMGSSLADATLSVAAGVILAPVSITAGLALRGYLGTLIALAVATLVLVLTPRHGRGTGALLLAAYFSMYALLL